MLFQVQPLSPAMYKQSLHHAITRLIVYAHVCVQVLIFDFSFFIKIYCFLNFGF